MDKKLEQVLHKVELLCEQNPEFALELKEKLGIVLEQPSEPHGAPLKDSFASAMRLQHKRCRDKARGFYEDILDVQLYQDLINAYSYMLWYKSIFEIGQYFVHVNYQVENMLNYYLDHSDFYKKVADAPFQYKYRLEINPTYVVPIDVSAKAFDVNNDNKPIEPSKLSMWVKLLYWAIDTNKKELLEKKKTYFNAIISVRNETNHANYASEKKSLSYWQNQDSLQFGYIEDLIKKIRDSIISLEKK